MARVFALLSVGWLTLACLVTYCADQPMMWAALLPLSFLFTVFILTDR